MFREGGKISIILGKGMGWELAKVERSVGGSVGNLGEEGCKGCGEGQD